MGIINFFSKKEKPSKLTKLPSGSFTLDRDGKILTSTLPQWFPASYVEEISSRVLEAFRSAQRAQMPLSEIVIHYAALKVLARELRGGAMVFLMPQVFHPHTKIPQPEPHHG
jgi:hypothetical protein